MHPMKDLTNLAASAPIWVLRSKPVFDLLRAAPRTKEELNGWRAANNMAPGMLPQLLAWLHGRGLAEYRNNQWICRKPTEFPTLPTPEEPKRVPKPEPPVPAPPVQVTDKKPIRRKKPKKGAKAERANARDRADPDHGWRRKCWKCVGWKLPSEFPLNRSDRKGIGSTCRECMKGCPKLLGVPSWTPESFFAESYVPVDPERAHHSPVWGRLHTLLEHARGQASKLGLPYNLTIGWALGEWAKQKGCCHVTGIPLEIDTSPRKTVNPFAAYFDLRDPKLGYLQSNTRVVCGFARIGLGLFEASLKRPAPAP